MPTSSYSKATILRGGHVTDLARSIDRVTDIAFCDGLIVDPAALPEGTEIEIVDLAGHYVSPGWVDLHVHAYGTLGFADPDSIGVYHGVTTFVEAGGPGIGTLDEFMALMDGLETSLYAGPFIRPMGLLGLNFIEGDVRTLGDVPITKWVDFAKQHRDLLRYIKCNAIGDYGPGTLRITKGLAEILDLPLYMHIGEFQMQRPERLLAYEAFRIADKGDMITHLYHGNLGKVVDGKGRVESVVRDAERRGVLFDLGFGGYNFSWDVAEKAFAQDLVPHTISSDLQQFNVVRPAKSLANVMSVMLRLGLTRQQVIERVTIAPAKALSLTDRAGSLAPGMPADITVYRVDGGDFKLDDCYQQTREASEIFVPVMTFKKGKRFIVDMERGRQEANWFLQIAEEHVPAAAAALADEQRRFLSDLADALERTTWELGSAEKLDVEKALELQAVFHAVLSARDLTLRDALRAVYDCFVEQRFTMQIGLFIIRLEQGFALARLRDVARQRPLAA